MTYPLVRMKFIVNEKLMYGANESAELDDRDLPRYIRITDLDSGGNLKEETFKSLEWEKAKPYLLRKGDILFARSGATVGKAYIHETDEPACYAGYLIKLKVDLKKCVPKFVFYYTQTNKYASWIAENTIQATIQNVSAEKYANLLLPLPSLKSQEIIIKYLENNVSYIDGLIAKKIKYIDLLEQNRQSIITETVTKGLNPNVKMKDSGVEWIGEIPEHWNETKLKFVIRYLIDAEHKTVPYELDGEYLVARTNNIKKGNLILNDAKYTDYKGYEEWTERGIPEENDVLLTREAPAGEACVVPKEPILCLGQRVVLLKLNSKINSHFLVWSIYGGVAATYIKLLSQGSTVTHFNMADIKNIPLLLPGIEEQNEIVKYINEKANQFDELIRTNQNQIELLKEYRQSLIYEAVTGKIDVREMEID